MVNDFFTDTTGLRTLVKAAWRTMNAVFKRSGVVGAHPHRFRHTLASELLGKGGSIEEIAGILGDSPATIRRHYAKWTRGVSEPSRPLIRKIHGTNLAQAEEQAVSGDYKQVRVVARDGIEPPTPAFSGLDSADSISLI